MISLLCYLPHVRGVVLGVFVLGFAGIGVFPTSYEYSWFVVCAIGLDAYVVFHIPAKCKKGNQNEKINEQKRFYEHA